MASFSWKQRAMLIPPLLLGGILIAVAPHMKAEPPKADAMTNKKVVRVLKMVPRKIQPLAVGYGHTEPDHEWEAKSQVAGSVVWVSDSFKNGTIVKQDEPLLKLDPSAYELTLAQLEAEQEVARLKDETINALIKIAQQDYRLQQAEAERINQLSKTGHMSGADKDKSRRELLNSEQQLQNLKNNLAINKAEQKVLATKLRLAARDLELTTVRAPFDARITETKVGLADFVNQGTSLLQADGVNAVEINAQFPIGKMSPLHRASSIDTISVGTINESIHSKLQALVELKVGNKMISWEGKVNRSGGRLDAQTQSQSIIVTVDKPYEQSIPGKRPPLVRDTFVKVTLKAAAMKKQMLVPVNAIHNNQVYLVNSDGKLEKRKIEIDFVQEQIAVIRSGLQPDDIVILSKLSSAVEGMNLKPQPDKKMVKWLDNTTGFPAPSGDKSGNGKTGTGKKGGNQ